jgi:hypothetical protein
MYQVALIAYQDCRNMTINAITVHNLKHQIFQIVERLLVRQIKHEKDAIDVLQMIAFNVIEHLIASCVPLG